MDHNLPGLMALGTSPPPKAKHRTSFDYQHPVMSHRGGTVAFEKAHIPATSQIVLSMEDRSSMSTTTCRTPALTGTSQLDMDACPVPDTTRKYTFKAYFLEDASVKTSVVVADGASRVRQVVLRFFPADGTLSMCEEESRNDGMAAGRFLLKRSKVPGVGLGDMAVGATLLIASRLFTLFWSDEFTRNELGPAAAGAPNFEPPGDVFATKLAAEAAEAAQWHGHKTSASTRFVEASRVGTNKPVRREFADAPLLRFLLRWDAGAFLDAGEAGAAKPTLATDPCAPLATVFSYWLTYELASGELDVTAVKGGPMSSGLKTLVKRGKLPKGRLSMGPSEIGSLSSVVDDGPNPVRFFTEEDFAVGGTVEISGRTMDVLDCDEPTAAWYAAHKGIDQRARRIAPESLNPPPAPPRRKPEPLVPRAMRPDRSTGYDPSGRSSRFSARLVANNPIDAERVFSVSVSHDDGQVGVVEVSVRNSGVVGGVFQKKQLTPYALADFVPGAEMTLKGHRMVIVAEETATGRK